MDKDKLEKLQQFNLIAKAIKRFLDLEKKIDTKLEDNNNKFELLTKDFEEVIDKAKKETKSIGGIRQKTLDTINNLFIKNDINRKLKEKLKEADAVFARIDDKLKNVRNGRDADEKAVVEAVLSQIKPVKDGKDGKDADEEVIVEKVVKKIEVPKVDYSKLEDFEKTMREELRKGKRIMTPAKPKGSNIPLDVTNFGSKLSSADDTVQKALDTIDDHTHAEDLAHADLSDMDATVHDSRYYTEAEIDTNFIPYSLADAANDFLVASGADTFVKKTLAETGAILEGDIVHDNLQSVHQSVVSGATPTFGDIKGETKCWDVTITDPNGFYDIDTQIPVALVKSAMTITKIQVSLNATGNQVAGDLKWADDLTAFTGATVINDFDTTSGVRTDTSITSGSVAAGKWIYLQFDSQPNAAITWMTIHIEWDID